MLNYIKNNKGFTLIELIVGIGILLSLTLAGFMIYAGIHFIVKFW